MRGLKKRTTRIAGLLTLALGVVALLAVSGVAAAKDHGRDDNGGHHGRHHHHGRQFEMREAGTISAFDATTGKLTIALLDGGTVTGLVTENTEIKCEGIDNRLDRRDHGGSGSDNSGRGSGDDNGGSNNSGPGNSNGGQNQSGDDNGGRGEPEPGDDNGGEEMPPVGTPAPEGEASCSVASLVPGAVVGDAELRLEGGSAFFEEVELGNHS
jgi:hypothetical protein